jgi:hypothetical protein
MRVIVRRRDAQWSKVIQVVFKMLETLADVQWFSGRKSKYIQMKKLAILTLDVKKI